jgi:hypothetical protein
MGAKLVLRKVSVLIIAIDPRSPEHGRALYG